MSVDGYGFDKGFHDRFMRVLDLMVKYYWRVDVEGIENIPEKGPALLVQNHAGTIAIDVLVIKNLIYRLTPANRIAWTLMADFVTYTPFVSELYWRTGNVLACWENGERLLKEGHLVTVCPEGTKGVGKHFIKRYELVPFGKGGFARLVVDTDAPIIPVSIIGSEEIYPVLYKNEKIGKMMGFPFLPLTMNMLLLGPLGFIPFPSKWRVCFGKPIHASEFRTRRRGAAAVAEAMAKATEGTIRRQILEQRKKRRSVFF